VQFSLGKNCQGKGGEKAMTDKDLQAFEEIEAKLYNLIFDMSLSELIVPAVHHITHLILEGSLTFEEAQRAWLELTASRDDLPIPMLVRLWYSEIIPETRKGR